jgi:hypothetical protein
MCRTAIEGTPAVNKAEGADHDRFAVELARCPGVPARLLELHLDDGSGRCRICSSGAGTGRYRHPCAIRVLATEALVIQGRKRLDKGERPIWLGEEDEKSD